MNRLTDFKYLGYRISEYKSDLEDKLQNLQQNKRSNTETFWKTYEQRNKLRIHNITAKAAMQFGSDAWVLKKREERRLEVAQMKFVRHLLEITKLDKENNRCIWEKNASTEYSKGNKTVAGKVATTRTEDGHKQNTKTSVTI